MTPSLSLITASQVRTFLLFSCEAPNFPTRVMPDLIRHDAQGCAGPLNIQHQHPTTPLSPRGTKGLYTHCPSTIKIAGQARNDAKPESDHGKPSPNLPPSSCEVPTFHSHQANPNLPTRVMPDLIRHLRKAVPDSSIYSINNLQPHCHPEERRVSAHIVQTR